MVKAVSTKTVGGARRLDTLKSAPVREEHRDIIVRNVLCCVEGKWSRFENLLKAKTILLPEHHYMIYINPEQLERKCPTKHYLKVMDQFGLTTIQEIWEHLWNTSINPYATVDHHREVDANGNFKPVKTRKRRELNYKISFDDSNDTVMQRYFSLCPQARSIVTIIDDEAKRILKGDPDKAVVFSENELKDLLEIHRDKLQTKQSSWRIFQYYRGKLIQLSFLRYAR